MLHFWGGIAFAVSFGLLSNMFRGGFVFTVLLFGLCYLIGKFVDIQVEETRPAREKKRKEKMEQRMARNKARDERILELQQKSERLIRNNVEQETVIAAQEQPEIEQKAPEIEQKQPIVVQSRAETTQKAVYKKRFCRYCGSEIDPVTKKCSGCGKQYLKIDWKIIAVAVLSFMLVLLIAFGAVNIAKINEKYTEMARKYWGNTSHVGYIWKWDVLSGEFDGIKL